MARLKQEVGERVFFSPKDRVRIERPQDSKPFTARVVAVGRDHLLVDVDGLEVNKRWARRVAK